MSVVNEVTDLTLEGDVAVITLDSPPVNALSSNVRDGLFKGFVAAIALLAGIHAARRDGVGTDCDLSLYDTAPDGYQAIRSYSIASSPLDVGEIELTVDCLTDGEVSPFMHDVVEVGDELELRGPLTEYFTWEGSSPLLLIGGGSGIVPLMSMLRHRRRVDSFRA